MCCTVGKCCCCISLRTGVIIIASLWTVGDSLLLAWMSYVTFGFNRAVQILLANGYWDADPENRAPSGNLILGLFWMAVMFVAILSVAVPLDIMLLVGAITGRPKLLRGWMVAYAVVYILFVLFSGLNLLVGFIQNPYHALTVAPAFLVHAGLLVYFWVVVRSYFLQLGGSEPSPTAGKVYRTVSMGADPPAHGINSDAGGMAMGPTPTARYIRSPQALV